MTTLVHTFCVEVDPLYLELLFLDEAQTFGVFCVFFKPLSLVLNVIDF